METESELLRTACARIDDLADPAFIKDSALNYVAVNTAYARLFGLHPSEFIGRTSLGLSGTGEDADRKDADRKDKECRVIVFGTDETAWSFDRSGVARHEIRLERFLTEDDHTYILGSFASAPGLAELGDPLESASADVDRRPSPSSLFHEALMDEDLQTILHALPVGVGILDENFLFEYANPAFYNFWDAGEQFDLPGRSYRDFLRVNFDHGIYSGSTLSFERIYEDRIAALTDGADRPPIEVKSRSGRSLVVSGTRLSGGKILLSHMDITAVREREQEVHEARAALEQHGALMRDATSAMSQGLLILHDGEIIFSNDALPSMLDMPADMVVIGGLWREIFGVLGMAELLAKSKLDTRQKTFIDIIVKSGNALLTVINDILDFSKVDAGQMKLRKAPFDPVEAIEDVATLLSSSAAEKDIELIVRGDASIRETVLGDAGRFRQIITNLVGNAVKFTEKGHVFIDLVSTPRGPGEMMLSVRIEDTGLGIPDEKLRSVFEQFSQVDTSSTRRHEGTGLGLAIAAGLTELFGGHIEVESEFGTGSVFTVHLPFQVVSARNLQTVLPINTKGARILVVDDNPVNRRILIEQLGMWGFDCVAAESGAEGLAIMTECARIGVVVDAIVLDYHMPEMNGLDFAKHLRLDPGFDATGIIFLTSMDMAGDDTLFAALNVQAHLMKPARASLLRSTVIDVVRLVRTRRHANESRRMLGDLPAALLAAS